MKELEIFLQGEGIPKITLVLIPSDGTVRSILETAQSHGFRLDAEDTPIVMIENSEEVLAPEKRLDKSGIGQRSRVHIHRCRRVEVSVNFNAAQQLHEFPPAATVGRVKQWAVREFGLPKVDATEHTLQICGSAIRPDEDTHIGSLVQYPDCSLCFDLVPKQRIEG